MFHAIIDTGALITGLSNKAVAEYLLKNGLDTMKGVVYLDELDRQMVLLRKGKFASLCINLHGLLSTCQLNLIGFKVVKLADSGLAWNERFTFYDQVSCFNQ